MNKEQQAFIKGYQLGLRDAATALDALMVAPESWTVTGEGHTSSYRGMMQVAKDQLQSAILNKANDATSAAIVWDLGGEN